VAASQKAMAQRGHFTPAYTELTFGFDKAAGVSLPPLVILTPNGNELRLRGKIDRVDLLENKSAFAVIDYKLSDRRISMEQVYHGISLQLLAYLLVIQAHGEQLTGKPLTPAAAFYMKLLRQLESVKHPDEGTDPASQVFHLRTKPRGIVDKNFAPRFDSQLQVGTSSDVIAASIKKDGAYSSRGDVAAQHELYALLGHVEEKLAQLADQVLEGVVAIAPYRLRTNTPCPNCEYKSVCRFQVGLNHYTNVATLSRDEVLSQLAGGGNNGA
jgi:ATP-dependent helicase/nuclease subunit B